MTRSLCECPVPVRMTWWAADGTVVETFVITEPRAEVADQDAGRFLSSGAAWWFMDCPKCGRVYGLGGKS